MTDCEAIKTLRNGGMLNMFDKRQKLFVKFQLNRKETKFICWQRFFAKSRGAWVKQNDCLSLRDVMNIRKQMITAIS